MQILIKKRLFIWVVTGKFDELYLRQCKQKKNIMKYKWKIVNTLLFLIMEESTINKNAGKYVWFVEYFGSQAAPEPRTEGAMNILKWLLEQRSNFTTENLNAAFVPRTHLKKEFSAAIREWVDSKTSKYLKYNRIPVCQRSKKAISTVIDNIFKESDDMLRYETPICLDEKEEKNHPIYSDSEKEQSDNDEDEIDMDLAHVSMESDDTNNNNNNNNN